MPIVSDFSIANEGSVITRRHLLNAKTFEVEKDNSKSNVRGISGVLSTDEDLATFEALKELCQRENVDKVMIVYHNYTFSLVGVSFTETNPNPPNFAIGVERNYRFRARDIHLDSLAQT